MCLFRRCGSRFKDLSLLLLSSVSSSSFPFASQVRLFVFLCFACLCVTVVNRCHRGFTISRVRSSVLWFSLAAGFWSSWFSVGSALASSLVTELVQSSPSRFRWGSTWSSRKEFDLFLLIAGNTLVRFGCYRFHPIFCCRKWRHMPLCHRCCGAIPGTNLGYRVSRCLEFGISWPSFNWAGKVLVLVYALSSPPIQSVLFSCAAATASSEKAWIAMVVGYSVGSYPLCWWLSSYDCFLVELDI